MRVLRCFFCCRVFSASGVLDSVINGEALEEAGGLEHHLIGAMKARIECVVDGALLGDELIGIDDVGGGLRGLGEREGADEAGTLHGGGLHEVEALGDVGADHPETEGFERDSLRIAEILERGRGIGEFADEVGFAAGIDLVFGLGAAGVFLGGGIGLEVFVEGDHDDKVYQTETVLQVGF